MGFLRYLVIVSDFKMTYKVQIVQKRERIAYLIGGKYEFIIYNLKSLMYRKCIHTNIPKDTLKYVSVANVAFEL